jgi:CheY-like chemotaxis protein
MLAAVLRLRNPELAVQIAHDGESGLAFVLANQHDVVIVDLNLSGIDGADIAMQIRRQRERAPPVLIALSGNVAAIARHQGSGVFEHAFTKPANVDRLSDILIPQA